jgi:hypothetical protein
MNQQILGNGTDKDILIRIKDYIRRYHHNHGKVPKQNIIKGKFNLTKYQLSQYIKILTHEGFLKQNYAHYKFDSKAEKIKIIKENKKNDIILVVLRIIMFIIGIGAIILSVYYTAIWLVNYIHPILAYILSAIMIAFSVGVFEIIIIFKGNKQYLFILPFIFLWLIVLCFSMVSTVAGQYNQRIENINEDIIEKSSDILDRKGYEILLEEEKELRERIKEKRKELIPFESIMSTFETIQDRENNKWLYWDTYEKIKKINEYIDKLRNDLENKRNEIKDYYKKKKEEGKEVESIEETTERKVSFYVWISSILNIEPKYIEFWLSVFPAAFVDIIAPLAIAVSMFLKRKENKDEYNN